MKIVDYDTFIRMPAGTIFAPYKPCMFVDRFQIKVDGGWADTNYKGEPCWFFNGTMPLEPYFIDADHYSFGTGTFETEMSVYDGDSTDAKEYELFAVMERHEVIRLILALRWALNGCALDFEDYAKYMEDFYIVC